MVTYLIVIGGGGEEGWGTNLCSNMGAGVGGIF